MALKEIIVPDIGDFDDVEIIEVLVSKGDRIEAEDSLITVESDKASMEIPAPEPGVVAEVKVHVGDRVSEGTLILMLDPAAEETPAPPPREVKEEPVAAAPAAEPIKQAQPEPPKPSPTATFNEAKFSRAHASPSVRKFARELGVDLSNVQGSGNKGRILKDDVKAYVKKTLAAPAAAGAGLGVAPMPEIDFSQFGEIETQPLTKINKLTGQFLHRNWVSIPHVTQFDEADITEMEAFRKQLNAENKDKGLKVTPLAFIMKAIVAGMKEYPRFNSSLDASGENLILKKYFHIGVAVDTPDGLVVPVIRDVDQKSLLEITDELREMSVKARKKQLKPGDMQGGSMSISSLGGIGGTKFTPIVNAPEVAILGVSKASMKPVWNGSEFEPRLMLPLSLSYDHRVVDGADGARFTTYLSMVLSDIRRLLL
jgi:pyruvate dehydrogenase E2 component (dihydrolipoamide acetyltransferase)